MLQIDVKIVYWRTLQSNWSVPNISSPGRYQYAKRWALCALFVDEGRLKINLLMNHKSSDNLGLNQPRQRKCIFSSWNCVQTRLPCAYLEIDIPRLVTSTSSKLASKQKSSKPAGGGEPVVFVFVKKEIGPVFFSFMCLFVFSSVFVCICLCSEPSSEPGWLARRKRASRLVGLQGRN